MTELPDQVDHYDSDSEDDGGQKPVASLDLGKYEDPLKGGTCPTNLVVKNYCMDWQPRHAWREFYQNW
jgi:hypothetical protein